MLSFKRSQRNKKHNGKTLQQNVFMKCDLELCWAFHYLKCSLRCFTSTISLKPPTSPSSSPVSHSCEQSSTFLSLPLIFMLTHNWNYWKWNENNGEHHHRWFIIEWTFLGCWLSIKLSSWFILITASIISNELKSRILNWIRVIYKSLIKKVKTSHLHHLQRVHLTALTPPTCFLMLTALEPEFDVVEQSPSAVAWSQGDAFAIWFSWVKKTMNEVENWRNLKKTLPVLKPNFNLSFC